MKRSLILLVILSLMVPVMFLGCEGDDGATGAAGAPGAPGVPGDPGPPGPGVAATPESCSVCHSSVATIHAATDVATVNNVNIVEGASLVVTFNVKVDGVNSDAFTLRRAYVNWDNTARKIANPALITSFQRDTITDNVTLVSNGAGNYTATVPTAFQIDNAAYLFQLQSTASSERPVVVATWGTRHLRNLVSDTGCASCHGPFPAWSEKFSHYAVGGSNCQICHSQYSRVINFISRNAAGTLVNVDNVVFGTNLVEYVHGIHNSHNMPPDRTYYRNIAPGPENWYSVGYPSDMRNCKVCHETPAQLTAAATAPVSYYLCMSCHNNWDGFVDHHTGAKLIPASGGLSFHRNFAPTVNCMVAGCHADLPTKNEAADFHIDMEASDRHYDSFFGGTDISYDNPDNVAFAIGTITKSGDNVTFTWTASKNGSAVNPCNDNLALGPSFKDLGAYLAYAKGDDWVNENVGSSPGQPAGSRNLFTSLSTTCASNVATTTGLKIAAGTGYAKKALLAIGGKPVTRHAAGDYFVRFPSPTKAFSMVDGSPVAARRGAVDTAKCLKCHRGTLYQHGGDRVDNEQLCVICHNPSAGEKNVRQVTYKITNADGSVNTSATYDGKVNETFDMRYMLHAIHGIDKREVPLVIYRGRGIYAFVTPDTVPPTGWPLVSGEPVPAFENAVVFGSTNVPPSRQTHNWTVVHYPKSPKECTACHADGLYEAPDQTKAVALTIDPGTSFTDQSDDIVIGPTAAACTACHATAPVRSHTTQFGYRTNVTKEEMLLLAQP